ncbi:mitochondrial ribosomal protein l16 [Phaffia rhodozyma]|uniref:Mitochondrial ribosomal protein l16 n=1 Tax=Phaffia rhodozyma TaxID=264483 RepID=A0A0F7SQB9_PHARH|nr:mitochondrial ribosomal protein l16 [Phaffia rhodozyma]
MSLLPSSRFSLSSLRRALPSVPSSSSLPVLRSSPCLPSSARSTVSPLQHATLLRLLPPMQTRGIKFAPKRTKTTKTMKGRIPIRTGGSTRGTTLAFGGEFGIRVKMGIRLRAKQLEAMHDTLRKKLKPYKGAEIIMRVFPDRPIAVKGNQTRMGKGKGAFEYWSCNVAMNHTLFEIRGGNVRQEIAREACRVATCKIACATQFMTAATFPRVGRLTPEVVVEDIDPLTPEELMKEAEEERLQTAHDGTEIVESPSGKQQIRYLRPVKVSEKLARTRVGTGKMYGVENEFFRRSVGVANGEKRV